MGIKGLGFCCALRFPLRFQRAMPYETVACTSCLLITMPGFYTGVIICWLLASYTLAITSDIPQQYMNWLLALMNMYEWLAFGMRPRVNVQFVFFSYCFHRIGSNRWLLDDKVSDYLVGGFKHFLFSISYMGCHPSHWRPHMFQDGENHQPVLLYLP